MKLPKKVVILAGGYGTRLSEETQLKPKPMVEIGGRPILWHIMKFYHCYGIDEFIICLGYKGYVIKEYFCNYFRHMSDMTIDMSNNAFDVHHARAESWKVSMIDTGQDTMTGGRLKRVQDYVGNEPFYFTYGDGLSNVDIYSLTKQHFKKNKIATVTAVRPPSRFGSLDIENETVKCFLEKPIHESGWINGGFFVLSPKVFDYIAGDSISFEREPLEMLAKQGQLAAYKHNDFWQPMDTLRDKHLLEELLQSGNAPWKKW